MTVFWSIFALALMLPAVWLSWTQKTEEQSLVYRGALFLALAGPSSVSLVHLGGHWDSGISISLWLTVSFSLLMFFCLSLMEKQFSRLAPLLLPYLFVLAIFAVIWQGHVTHQNIKSAADFWLTVHIIASIVTYALCTLAAIAAFSVLLRERALKAKKMESRFLGLLPSVYDADRFQVSLLTMAEVILGLGILTGMARQYSETSVLLQIDHKTLLAFIAFVVIAVLLALHRYIGIRGQNAVRFVLAVYLLLTLAYPGVKFVTDFILPETS
ncbi:cytochrome C assembly family protein [Kiloniella laminariae]|uniref:cytochrome C assembly family protein n=1 Tax=Kiloniella laminariae TaxID=454162 RepID=UPI00035EE7CC|nr:cytochrome c biogenesis protein CcsA [Kiloniella laminariae]